jgi:hypothetical protein
VLPSAFTYRPYRFNDIKLFVILIPLIAAINYFLTYHDIRLNGRLALTFFLDVQQGYVGWYCCRMVILYMDKVYPYQRSLSGRIALQVFFSSFVGVGIIILQTMLMNYLFTDNPLPISFFTLDVIIITIWFFVVNGIYIGIHFYSEWQNAEVNRRQDQLVRSEGYLVKVGKKSVAVPFNTVNGFTIENEYAVLKSTEPKNYFLDESLDAIEKRLPAEHFFRLNRQFIVHRNLITGFERIENGKINVLLKSTSHFPSSIPVSRLRAAAFRSWFLPEQ